MTHVYWLRSGFIALVLEAVGVLCVLVLCCVLFISHHPQTGRLMSRKLSPRKLLFLEAYTTNGANAYQAALYAGYSKSYAKVKSHRLVRQPEFQPMIKAAQSIVHDELVTK